MNHKEKLLEIYSQCIEDNLNVSLSSKELNNISTLGSYAETQKGVFTVLLTLGIHKILNPHQDVRFHQTALEGGFSGRSIDTKYITPTLKELKLPSMSESGWLTRSLEQPYPYKLDYQGKISNKKVKKSFLELVHFVNENYLLANQVIYLMLKEAIAVRERNTVAIEKIDDADHITIERFMEVITSYMETQYSSPGGSKIPVIVFYTVYEILVNEMKRYDNCTLKEMGFHTTSDRTSKSSGDIEVFKNDKAFESVEIKFDISIDVHMVNRAIEKIHRFNPSRYYILSTSGVLLNEQEEVSSKIFELEIEHGCQLIVNGFYPTLKYYMRLITDMGNFINKFSYNIVNDSELKIEHKEKWKYFNNALLSK